VGAAFGAAGQRCMALSTAILVGETREWLTDLKVWLCVCVFFPFFFK
jgi:acyl-CoA reductase-like NAD-dependent aldehyde dehydrogenase